MNNLLKVGSGDPYADYLFYDAMLGANLAAISSRPAEKGGNWMDSGGVLAGLITDGNGYAKAASGGFEAGESITVSNQGSTVRIDMTFKQQFVSNMPLIGIFFNFVDRDNLWFFWLNFNLPKLQKVVGSHLSDESPFPLGGVAIVNNAMMTLSVLLNPDDNELQCLIDGADAGWGVMSFPGREFSTAQKHGALSYINTGEQHLIDTFTVRPFSTFV